MAANAVRIGLMATHRSLLVRGHTTLLSRRLLLKRSTALPSFTPRQPVAFMSSNQTTKKPPRTVKVTFIDRDGDEMTVDAKIGDTLLEVAKQYDVDLEGACEGTLSCSTCHLIADQDWYDKIPDILTEEEQDMLDLAFGLTDTSRLGCQIVVSDAIDGIRLTVPAGTTDARNV